MRGVALIPSKNRLAEPFCTAAGRDTIQALVEPSAPEVPAAPLATAALRKPTTVDVHSSCSGIATLFGGQVKPQLTV